MLKSLLLAAPSVPNATFTPALSILATGAKPEASFKLLSTQWDTPTFRFASNLISLSVSHTQWAADKRSESKPMHSKYSTGVLP